MKRTQISLALVTLFVAPALNGMAFGVYTTDGSQGGDEDLLGCVSPAGVEFVVRHDSACEELPAAVQVLNACCVEAAFEHLFTAANDVVPS
jgi:hypothetical protein